MTPAVAVSPDLLDLRPVAAFARRRDAAEAVASLALRGIAAELALVQGAATGRGGRWRLVAARARSGALAGALFGVIFWILDLVQPTVAGSALALYLIVIGAVLGALVGVVAVLDPGSRRAAVPRYLVLVPGAAAADAGATLAGSGRTDAGKRPDSEEQPDGR